MPTTDARIRFLRAVLLIALIVFVGAVVDKSVFAAQPSENPLLLEGPDLSVRKTHLENFSQGEQGAVYTIIVRNVGTAASAGTVTVTDVLPEGLTAVKMIGPGWDCDTLSLTCTRSDVLAAPARYPDITLTVNVAEAAPAQVINTVTVAGGGDVNPANNTAQDPTVVNSFPDLVITKTHTGDFYQGQQDAKFTITITNAGGAPFTGGVLVTDSLPEGLIYTGMFDPQ